MPPILYIYIYISQSTYRQTPPIYNSNVYLLYFNVAWRPGERTTVHINLLLSSHNHRHHHDHRYGLHYGYTLVRVRLFLESVGVLGNHCIVGYRAGDACQRATHGAELGSLVVTHCISYTRVCVLSVDLLRRHRTLENKQIQPSPIVA